MTTPNQAATSDDSKATPGGVPVLGGNSMLPLGVVLDESTRAAITDISRRLTEPFPENEIEWLLKDGEVARVGDKFVGRCFAYVTARAVQERLGPVPVMTLIAPAGNINHIAEQVDRQYNSCFGRNQAANLFNIHQKSIRININKNRCQFQLTDCGISGKKGEWSGDDFIAFF